MESCTVESCTVESCSIESCSVESCSVESCSVESCTVESCTVESCTVESCSVDSMLIGGQFESLVKICFILQFHDRMRNLLAGAAGAPKPVVKRAVSVSQLVSC